MLNRFHFDSVVNIFSRTPASPIPVGRSWHTLTAVSDTSLFLFGGLSVDCKPMSKKTLPPFHLLLFLDPFFSFWFDLKVMGGCLMLRQSYGENWSILLIISRGRKMGDLMIYILKYFKRTYFIYVFPLSKVVAHCVSGQRRWCDCVWGKLWLHPSGRHCKFLNLHYLFNYS